LRSDPSWSQAALEAEAAREAEAAAHDETRRGNVNIEILQDKAALGVAAAEAGIATMKAAIAKNGEATIFVATGMSQFEMLAHLVEADGIDWSKVTAFHLDEYVGLPDTHGASFRRYLRERFVAKLPALEAFVPVEGDAGDTAAELARLNGLLGGRRVDVGFAGIGENCHLAFNDPPADFVTEAPYLLVELDEACRRQQLGEGWFPTLADVPHRAISMSIRQILKAERLIISVPDARKAKAVQAAVEGEVSPLLPASILQRHTACTLYLDPPAASLLVRK
jgi:glucosamine-6-phosphate deaminase